MSHFVVAVITKNPADLEAALQPFHEFECTGTDDQYVQNIDRTQEALKEYAKDTESRLQAPDGTLHDPFDDKGEWKPEFSQLATEGIDAQLGRRIEFIPEGYTEVRVASNTVKSFIEWVQDYYGWKVKTKNSDPDSVKYGFIELNTDGSVLRCIDRSNPNKRWDWWTIGGRWNGSLLTKYGSKVDQARKSDIAFANMREDAEIEAAKEYDLAIKVIDGRPIPHWENFRVNLFPDDLEAARKAYHDDPVMVSWKAAYPDNFFGPSPEDYDMTREAFIAQAGDNSFSAFAVLDVDGNWHERGEMGWWGFVRDEQDKTSWGKQLQTFLASVPDDHYISMVDCHI